MCCLDVDRESERAFREMIPELRELKAQIESGSERLRNEYGIYINYVSPVEFNGRKVWAIGNRLYQDRSPNETFHEFLLHVLYETLGGEEWRASQTALPVSKRHFVMKCFDEYVEWTQAASTQENQQTGARWAAQPNGWVLCLISLAWDVATLIHTDTLPDALMDRLRDPYAYQGARHEIAVAAVFARLDCDVRFLDEDEGLRGKKHVEFVATHRPSGQQVAVEAKGRHRPGVLHEIGEPHTDDPLHGDQRGVRHLFMEALGQIPDDMPSMIFIDINAPLQPEAEGLDKQWIQDVRRWMDRLPAPTADKPSPCNALYVTNFAPHYQGNELAQGGEWAVMKPLYTSNPMSFDLTGMLDHAVPRCLRVPEIAESGEILG